MGYYQGDFYRGSQGDPFWGALLGVAKRVGGALLGGFGGGGAKAVGSSAAAGISQKVMGAGSAIVKRGVAGIIKHPVLSAAGAAGVAGIAAGAGAEMLHAGHPAMRGFHVNKHGKVVKNRHMNPCNPRALRRAVRRATRFTHLAMKTIHLVHPKKKVRFGGFKKRRRAA